MKLLAIALRNLARNRRRTAISLAVVAAGAVGLLLTAGFMRFSFDGLREALILGGLGHLEVAAKASIAGRDATPERPLAQGLEDWQPLQAEIERLPHVLAATANAHLMGMATGPSGATASFVGVGVEPGRERRMGFRVKLRAGDDLPDAAPAPGEDVVLIGVGLGQSLAVHPGDAVTLLAMTTDGTLNAVDMRVAGIVTTGVQELDTRFLKMPLASAQRLLGSDRVSDLVIGLDDTAETEPVEAELTRRLAGREPPLAVVDWQTRAPYYDQVRGLYRGIFWFLGSVIFVLVVLSTSNTLMMAVMERVREIGALRAIGTSRGQVGAIVLLEALWLGLLGALVGEALGSGLIVLINALKLKMPPPPGAVSPIDLRLVFVPEAFAGTVALMLLVLALAALVPMMKATRLRIVEALAHV